jgi:hypothetical protein
MIIINEKVPPTIPPTMTPIPGPKKKEYAYLQDYA